LLRNELGLRACLISDKYKPYVPRMYCIFAGNVPMCTLINVLYFSVRVSSSGSKRRPSRNAVWAVGGRLL